ncbi:hypothetical protein NP493_4956g00001 [Ridgeia piscesae]|uniref:Uncharacterized protein n=1 Tax=Ridgeia piscesae TaxID=27915 RepID=A0AAD9IY68_RIDPI|nr:hypothetical protein NP493_4956g00001 [Ridgeia piscesae]
MMCEVDHLGVLLSQFAKKLIGISCYKHVYTCSCAFVSQGISQNTLQYAPF